MTSLSDSKTIFLSGSRKLSKLNSVIKGQLLSIIENQHNVLVGDANGADKAFQQFLKDNDYKNVLVYHMESPCRNNVGGWKTCDIDSTGNAKKDAAYFAIKDAEMANDADYGLMLWDGKSKGTFNNIINMQKQDKQARVYFSPEKRFISVKSVEDIRALVKKCDEDSVAHFEKELRRLEKLYSPQMSLKFDDSLAHAELHVADSATQ